MHRLKQFGRLTLARRSTCWAAFSTQGNPDVIMLGAGHNGLVAATLLARQGLQVSLSCLQALQT